MPRKKTTRSSKQKTVASKIKKDNNPPKPETEEEEKEKEKEKVIPIDLKTLPSTEIQRMLVEVILRLVSPLKSLAAQTNEGIVYIRPEDVAYITTTDKSHISFVADIHGGQWKVNDPLITLKKELIQKDPRFFESHKSFIANLYAVHSLRNVKIGDKITNREELTFGKKVKGTAAVSSANSPAVKARLAL